MDEMDNGESSTDLPRSIEAWGTEEFIDVLQDELAENAEDFPLEACMDHGGSADISSIDLSLQGDMVDDADLIFATVRVFFDENTIHSGCVDLGEQTTNYSGVFEVTINKEDGSANIKLVEHEELSDEDEAYSDYGSEEEPDIYDAGED